MKNSTNNALQRLKEALAEETETGEFIMEKRVVRIFDLWIREKGYCRPEQTMQQVADSLKMSHSDLSWVCGRVYGTSFLILRKKHRTKPQMIPKRHKPQKPNHKELFHDRH